jgi:rubrerythrin
MSSESLDLETVDVDGAVRETAHDAATKLEESGDTRLDFFKKAGMTGGAIVGGGALLGALVPGAAMGGQTAPRDGGRTVRPPASFGAGDIGILNFALTLEYLERDFYKEAAKNNRRGQLNLGKREKNFLMTVFRDERAHVKFLAKALGSKAIAEPKFDFGKATKDRKTFLRTAFALENTGVGAYAGQAFLIENPSYAAAALSIWSVEARHAGFIGGLIKGDKGIAPGGPFDDPLNANQVLKAVGKTGFIKG